MNCQVKGQYKNIFYMSISFCWNIDKIFSKSYDVGEAKMNKMIKEKAKFHKDFYQNLREKINKWTNEGKLKKRSGKWTDAFLQYLMVLPDIAHLMIKLLADKDINSLYKKYILLALVYLVSPIDFVPDILPVAGLIDDLLVMVIILNKIFNSKEPEILKKIKFYWAGEADVFIQVKEIIYILNEISSKLPKALYKFIKKKI